MEERLENCQIDGEIVKVKARRLRYPEQHAIVYENRVERALVLLNKIPVLSNVCCSFSVQ